MATADARVEDREAVRADWLERLDALIEQIAGWAEAAGWRTRRTTKPVSEPALGRYEVPLLLLERAGVELALSPVASTAPGADGIVDLYMMPGYDDVASLHGAGAAWLLYDVFSHDPTQPGTIAEAERLPVDRESIQRLLDVIAARA